MQIQSNRSADSVAFDEMIGGIEALMITVEPGNSVEYIAELALMTPYHYLVTLDSARHLTHVLRIDMNWPDILLREVKDARYSDIFRHLNTSTRSVRGDRTAVTWAKFSIPPIATKWWRFSSSASFGSFRWASWRSWICRST